jgi:hypothetical protein
VINLVTKPVKSTTNAQEEVAIASWNGQVSESVAALSKVILAPALAGSCSSQELKRNSLSTTSSFSRPLSSFPLHFRYLK